MDGIAQIVSTFDESTAKAFRQFAQTFGQRNERKDLQLFDLFWKHGEPDKATIMAKLYHELNEEAYQALRKRLIKSLTRFVSLKLMDQDSSSLSTAVGLVNMARYLWAHHLYKLAEKYLQKAERLAEKNDLFEILNSIYVLQIQNSPVKDDERLNELMAKWKANKERLQQSELNEIALSVLTRKIKEAAKPEDFQNIEQWMGNVLADIQQESNYMQQPRFAYHVASIVRKKMLLEKDYFHLEPFLVRTYQSLESGGRFTTKHSFYQQGLLYMLAHTLFRNRKFKEALAYLDALEKHLQGAPKAQLAEFLPKAEMLKASTCMYTNQLENACHQLEFLLNNGILQKDAMAKANAQISLAVSCVYQGDFSKANRTLRSVPLSDKKGINQMGTEWAMKRALIETIVYFELGEFDLVDSRIAYLKRQFRPLFQQPVYQRVKEYLQYVEALSHTKNQQEAQKLQETMKTVFEQIPADMEDLQAMAFYSWLKAKSLGRDTYEVLLGVVE